jgi:N-acetylglucosamine-6-sulfatase
MTCALLLPLVLCGCGAADPDGRALGRGKVALATNPLAPGATAPAAPVSAPATAAGGGAAKRPNIVFVLTDDLAWNLVPYMPHVLAMERQGETFSNYFVTDSLCCPSRASIFSGRFPHNTQVTSNSSPYGGFSVFHERGEEQHTFATALQGVGYRTAMMGKYLNGYQPGGEDAGGVLQPASPQPPGWSEWDVAGNGYPEFGYRLNENGQLGEYGFQSQEYLTDVLARKGLNFIDRAAVARRPFLLELATFAPHSPFTPAPRDEEDFPGLKAPRTPAFDAANAAAPEWLSHFAPLEPQQIEQIDTQFRRRAQAVQAVDNMIALIEAELKARGEAKNTYIVFSSDNGLHMGEHRLMPGKQTAFDTDIRVPLIVMGPGVPPGRTVSEMSENIDLCPTFERLAGAPMGPNVDGNSLVELLHGQRLHEAWRKEILVEHHGPDLGPTDPDLPTRGAGNPSSYEALRTPTSLYVEYVTGEREYYNLRTDPFELRNLAAHLSLAHEQRLHRALVAIEGCRGRRSCWRAQHLPM